MKSAAKNSARRPARYLHRACAIALGTALGIGCAEWTLRWMDPFGVSHFLNMPKYGERLLRLRLESERLFEHEANASVQFHGWSAQTDSRGLRGPERIVPKPARIQRLLLLGDSLTFGWGVGDAETVPALAETELRELTGEAWETINAGHLHHDTTQEAAVLEEVGFVYEPDVVGLLWCGNDVISTRASLEADRPVHADPEVRANQAKLARFHRRWRRLKPWLPFTWATLHFVVGRREGARYLAERDGTSSVAADFGIDRELGWERCRAALASMQDLTRSRHIPFVVLIPGSEPKLTEFCEARAIPVIEIAPTEEEWAKGLRNSLADPHFNRTGNAIYARNLVRGLEELGLL